ncbi:MAG TPA: DMT family transporter, partial [Paracoccaceae bacterium]|nr:DMT family transporter [Paracoccaceae bacterium]
TRFIPAAFVLIWSTGFIGAKFALPYIEPFFLLAIRFAIVIPLFGLAALYWRGPRLSHSAAAFQILVGVLLHGGYLCGVFHAISAGTPAGIVAIIVGLQPILTSAMAQLWLGQLLSRRQSIGLMLGLAGVALVVTGGNGLGGQIIGPGGLVASLTALTGISLGSVLQKRIGGAVPLLPGMMLQYTGALMVALPLSLLFEAQTLTVTLPLILAMAWLILGLSGIATVLLMVMIRAGQTAKVSSLFYLVPPITLLQANAFFGETLAPVSALGGLLAGVGVYLVVRRSGRRPRGVAQSQRL